MAESVRRLLSNLEVDPWRKTTPFSADLEEAQLQLAATTEEDKRIDILRKWLERSQPCLFGRIAAKLDLLSFCLLTEEDLSKPDEEISGKIQEARTAWSRLAYEGKKSGFILVALSRSIAEARPDANTFMLAQRICELYLQREILPDRIYLDTTRLEAPLYQRPTWEWPTGVNYFCAQGDGRWWQDHRFPGGMAFSVNSVGHMVKAGNIARSASELEAVLDVFDESWFPPKVESLAEALILAMRTISLASKPASGKATYLLPLAERDREKALPTCPVELPASLRDKNFCEYGGYYHTDVTLPSDYFRPEVERPADVQSLILDFTYLFDDSLDNPDHRVVGRGQRVRMIDESHENSDGEMSTTDAESFDRADEPEFEPEAFDAASEGYRIVKRMKAAGRPRE